MVSKVIVTNEADQKPPVEDRLNWIEAALAEHQIFPTTPPNSIIQNIPEIDLNGFGDGSSDGNPDFLYPRAEGDANPDPTVRVTVPKRPEVVEADPSGFPYTPESVAAVKAWLAKYLPAQADRDVAGGEQTGQARADTHQARVKAYFDVTGYLPPTVSRGTLNDGE